MPKPNVCRTQAKKDEKLNEMIATRIKVLGSSCKAADLLGCSDFKVRDMINRPGTISLDEVRRINREIRKIDPTMVIPMEVYG